jgi:hypothetical protein
MKDFTGKASPCPRPENRFLQGFLCALLTASALHAVPTPTLEPQPDSAGRKVWHSPRFHIESDAALTLPQLQNLARLMEATFTALEKHDPPLLYPPQGRAKIILPARDEDFLTLGAPTLAAGFYDGHKPWVLLRPSSLQSTHPANSSTPSPQDALIIHELTHLGMHQVLPGLPHWLIEGLAEWTASAYRGNATFDFSQPEPAIRDFLRKRGDPRNPQVRLLHPQDTTRPNAATWLEMLAALPEADRASPYGTALLLTHYHLHGGPDRKNQIRLWLESAQSHPPSPPETTIPPNLHDALQRFWRPRGLDPAFFHAPDLPEATKPD